jgi:hypothetical protein
VAVLGGLNWDRHAPGWMLVETDDIGAVLACSPVMALIEQFSFHDYLLRRHDQVKSVAES